MTAVARKQSRLSSLAGSVRRQPARLLEALPFFKTDLESISDLLKYEPPEKPPTLEQLMDSTNRQFSRRWIQYMYARFKNECPSGRMKLPEFKKLFGMYMPDRLSDAYLERMFQAMCYHNFRKDQITFKDLLDTIALLHNNDAKLNAQWTLRLIHSRAHDRVTPTEFHEFVKSIFMLVGRERRPRADSVLSELRMEPAVTACIRRRSAEMFRELDTQNRGFLNASDLERLFSHKEFTEFLGLI